MEAFERVQMMSKCRISMREISAATIVLAAGGLFWFALAALSFIRARGGRSQVSHDWILIVLGVLILCLGALLVVGAIRLRQQARRFWFDGLPKSQQIVNRKVSTAYKLVLLGQVPLCLMAVLFAYLFDRLDLTWPMIAFVLSLHFFHLAIISRWLPYWAIAIVGAVLSGATIVLPVSLVDSMTRLIFLGAGMGMLCWTTAFYMITHSEHLAARRVGRPTASLKWE